MKNKGVAIPYVIWMAIFVVIPLILVVGFAFTSRSGAFTMENFSSMNQYLTVFGRSFLLAIIATLICILIGYPLAYWLSRESGLVKGMAMMLIMLPMWMNFLLRTYSWMSILEDTGLLNRFFSAVGIVELSNFLNGFLNELVLMLNNLLNTNILAVLPTDQTFIHMINTPGAVVLGMVYNFLPFMILPIFSVIDKIDPKIVEAAQDLGANGRVVFRRIIFPLSLPGVLSGITMVFIPSVSTFVITKLLGGSKTTMLGDLIEMQFFGNTYNPHLGSAISLVMMFIVLILMALMNRFGEGEEEAMLL